jgi:hypothetical protein
MRRSILYLAETRLLTAFPFNQLQALLKATPKGNAPSSAGRFHQLTETPAHVLQVSSRDTSKKEPAQKDRNFAVDKGLP